MKTGDIEIQADSVTILNRCKDTLPFHIHDFHKVCPIAQFEQLADRASFTDTIS